MVKKIVLVIIVMQKLSKMHQKMNNPKAFFILQIVRKKIVIVIMKFEKIVNFQLIQMIMLNLRDLFLIHVFTNKKKQSKISSLVSG